MLLSSNQAIKANGLEKNKISGLLLTASAGREIVKINACFYDCLKSRHGQMAYSKMATLVCPVSLSPGQGLYAEFFCLVLLIGCRNGKEKEPFS